MFRGAVFSVTRLGRNILLVATRCNELNEQSTDQEVLTISLRLFRALDEYSSHSTKDEPARVGERKNEDIFYK